jgi:hypothetical protein
MLSAKKLCRQDVAVVSHGHRDHWATNLVEKDVVLVPRETRVPMKLAPIRNIVSVDYSEKTGSIQFVKLGRERLSALLEERISTPHAFWWLARSKQTRVLFVGDVNVEDVPVARAFVAEMSKRDLPLSAAILPSFGGVSGHNSELPRQLASSIERLSYDLQDVHGMVLGALPHPVDAKWATYNAVPTDHCQEQDKE